MDLIMMMMMMNNMEYPIYQLSKRIATKDFGTNCFALLVPKMGRVNGQGNYFHPNFSHGEWQVMCLPKKLVKSMKFLAKFPKSIVKSVIW